MTTSKLEKDVPCLKDSEIDEFVIHLGKKQTTERIHQIEEHRRQCTACDTKIKSKIVNAMNRAVLPYVYRS